MEKQLPLWVQWPNRQDRVNGRRCGWLETCLPPHLVQGLGSLLVVEILAHPGQVFPGISAAA